MGRLALVIGVVVGLLILVLQNLSVVLPLVVLGQPLIALPVGVWMAIAIILGVLANGLLALLGSSAPPRRREPDLQPARSPSRRNSSRRQTVESMAEEIWEEQPAPKVEDSPAMVPPASQDEDEWVAAGREASSTSEGQRRSPGRIPRPQEQDDELEEVIGGWSEPNRSRQGWDYEPEWDEDEAWTQPGTGVRRRPPRDRQPSKKPAAANDSKNVANGNVSESVDRSEPNVVRSQNLPKDQPPQLKNFEKQGRPTQGKQTGSVYSYSYRDGDGGEVAPDGTRSVANGEETSDRAQPLVTPPPKPSTDNPPARANSRREDRDVRGDRTDEPILEIPPAQQRSRRSPLNLPPEPEAPQPSQSRRSVMDADYRVIRPPDPDYEGRSPRGRDGWDEQDGDWEEWEDW
ncbi:MAG: hypothetical protein AAF889_05305 [Cyanobacteria bacterium P01_D01_bin.73]